MTMKTPFQSRKFITTHWAMLLVFVMVLAGVKLGATEGIVLAGVTSVTLLAGGYNRENNIAKKYLAKIMGEEPPQENG